MGLHFEFEKLTVLTKATHIQGVGWEHKAVLRSYLQGLSLLHVPFNYNPNSVNEIGDVVHVVTDHNALIQAIELKRKGHIKKLFVGPNFHPHEVNYPEVDMYVVPSAWIYPFIREDCPQMESRCKVWFAGIDANFWQPRNDCHEVSKNVLVYWKTEPLSFCLAVEKLLQKYGWNPIRLQYGNYKVEQYKEILQTCRFAVFISVSESQGLALAEAWAMDVPTLPWNPKSATILGHQCNYVSACPYLTSQTGKDWQTIEELECILKSIENYLFVCEPREWVVQHMTDEVSVQVLLDIINDSICRNH